MTTDGVNYLTSLQQLLNQHFDLEGIHALCFKLNVACESVPGEEKTSLIRELLQVLGRDSRLPELITLALQEHPGVAWPEVPDDFQLFDSDVVLGDKVGGDKLTVGDVSGQSVVVVGEKARATINQYTEIIIRADNFEDLPPASGEPPYKGMAYFNEADKDIFFGREEISDQLANRLQTTRFLALIGASGSGKSSLLRAGIIPRLRVRNWQIHIIKPGVYPLTALSNNLTQDELNPATTDTVLGALATDFDTLHKVGEKLAARADAERLLLAVDQFEELFTQCKDKNQQQAFVANIVHAANAHGATTVLLNMRADFYDRVSEFPKLTDLVSQQQEYIKPMAQEDLVRVIAEPAKRNGWQIVAGLVEQIIEDVGREPGRLPLLSHALLETWERRRGVVMTLGGYRAAGGVEGAIAQTAEETLSRFTEQQSAVAQSVFLSLTELGEGTEDTRRTASLQTLQETNPDQSLEDVLQTLVNARLITTGNGQVEVAHEALIRRWPRLRNWLADNRERLRFERQLDQDAQRWEDLGRDDDTLYRGVRLQQAIAWSEQNEIQLTSISALFLETSQAFALRAARQAKAARQRKVAIYAIATLLAVVIVILIINQRALELIEQGDEYIVTGHPGLAIEAYENAKRLNPWRNLNMEFEKAEETLKHVQALELVQEGEKLAAKGDRKGAAIKFQEAVEVGPPPYTPIYVWIPLGSFTMGSDDKDSYAQIREKPQHDIFLDGYWIMRTEVTFERYTRCVEAGVCEDPDNLALKASVNLHKPIYNVDWEMASTYAEWVGGRLPSEAEWEKACRGDSDQRIHPWGDAPPPNGDIVNYNDIIGDPTDVGSYPLGISAFGLYDMGGNVWEYTRSLYKPDYLNSPNFAAYPYKPFDGREHFGPESVPQGIVIKRGAAFSAGEERVRCSLRWQTGPGGKDMHTGFRVVSPGPTQEAFEEIQRLAWEGNHDEAVARLMELKELHSELPVAPGEYIGGIMPMAEQEQILNSSKGKLNETFEVAINGEVSVALELLEQARNMNVSLIALPSDLDIICRCGAVYGLAEQVVSAVCAEAIALVVNKDTQTFFHIDLAELRDSRGVARAWTGDVQGAIEDFQAFIDWKNENDEFDEESALRKEWIIQLENGGDPLKIFDDGAKELVCKDEGLVTIE